MQSVRRALLLSISLLGAVGCCRPHLGPKDGYSAEAMSARVEARKGSLGRGWTVLAIPPFVVIGDGMPADVRRDSEEVVAVAVKKLKALYFERDPAAIVDLYMMRDTSSYDREAGTFLGPPSTPYGFYSPCLSAIYVNMENGNGTLVHEMVHAFMGSNFPACPPWLNEGLGSLYEQTDLESPEIQGRLNWRLPELKEAILKKETLPLDELMALDEGDLYDKKRTWLYYAMARYLCYYLQEKGSLSDYYHALVRDQARDPTGVETLKVILKQPDLKVIQREWEAATLALDYQLPP